MAWWTQLLFLRGMLEEKQSNGSEANVFVVFVRALRRAFYDNFVNTIHVILLVATYAYLAANIAVFFLQRHLSLQITTLIAAFSEPYLGALGIYIVVNEIRKRRGVKVHPHFSNIFAGAWMIFLLVSTFLVYFADSFHFNVIYRTVVTNSFAALIIRLGTILSRIP